MELKILTYFHSKQPRRHCLLWLCARRRWARHGERPGAVEL